MQNRYSNAPMQAFAAALQSWKKAT